MYEQLKDLVQAERIEVIARALVRVKSVNGTVGEVAMADKLEEIIRSFPWFQEHPEHIWTQRLKGDALGRKNVFALLAGAAPTAETVIYHGHMDTVGIDDFGMLKADALDPDRLRDYFMRDDRDPDVRADAASGDWLFGRGMLDMKSGDAVHLSNLLYYSEHRDRLKGNVLVMFNPVEENDHEGVMHAVSELIRLKREKKLHFVLAINGDFVSPLYQGDPNRYIYTGSAGKLLACFYIRGRETHVGETLGGIDPTLIATKINNALDNNMAAAEQIPGEVVLPPSCLYFRDQKAFYNVQTAGAVHLYFNYFLYERSPQSVLAQLMKVAEDACEDLEQFLSDQYAAFSDNCGLKGALPDWNVAVMTYRTFIGEVAAKGVAVDEIVAGAIAAAAGKDFRETSYKIIEALEAAAGDQRPKVIVFFAPPFCPPNDLRADIPGEALCGRLVDQVLAAVAAETGESLIKKRFFPYLADSSYLAMNESEAGTAELIGNFPGWGQTYRLPLEEIRALNIPVLDIGVYGKKAHTWKERVYKPYSYHTVPRLIRKMTEAVFASVGAAGKMQ